MTFARKAKYHNIGLEQNLSLGRSARVEPYLLSITLRVTFLLKQCKLSWLCLKLHGSEYFL